MESDSITVYTVINANIFRKFTFFNIMLRPRRWKQLLTFALIMSAFAIACFVLRSYSNQAIMIGVVLLIVGLGLPAVNLLSVEGYIKSQIKAYGLKKPHSVYTLQLSKEPDGIQITNPGGEFAKYEWENLHSVYRVDGCIYMYVIENKAFLLPDGQADKEPDALWRLLKEMVSSEKLYDHRKKIRG